MNVITDFINAFGSLAKAFDEVWSEISKTVHSIHDAVIEVRYEIQQDDYIRSTWFVDYDTRKPSQVLNRKPRMSKIRSQL